MKIWKPAWDALVTLFGVVLLLLLTFKEFLPVSISAPLSQPATATVMIIVSGLILLTGVIFGTVRHKEASPFILSGLGILCLLLPVPSTLLLQIIAVSAFVAVAILSIIFRQHSLDIPRAPSMEDLMQDAL